MSVWTHPTSMGQLHPLMIAQQTSWSPPSAHHSAKHLAMDVSVVSPDNVGPLNQGSHTNQYKAAKQTEHRKLREYTSFLATR